MHITKLSDAVHRKITANSSASSPETVIKELIDNAIDSGAQSILVSVDDSTAGLNLISVKDDGSGISKEDLKQVCIDGATSKITSIADLKSLSTLGFRGEALSVISNLSNGGISFISKERGGEYGLSWDVDVQGHVINDPKVISTTNGTTVTVKGLYDTYPIRKRFLSKKSVKTHQLIEELIDRYSLVFPGIRFELRKVQIVQGSQISKVVKSTIRLPANQSGSRNLLFNQEDYLKGDFDLNETGDIVSCLVPRSHLNNDNVKQIRNSLKVLAINRHVLNPSLSLGKSITKLINEVYSDLGLQQPTSWFVNFTISSTTTDFNVEPQKDDCIVGSLDLLPFKEYLVALLKNQVVPAVPKQTHILQAQNPTMSHVDVTPSPEVQTHVSTVVDTTIESTMNNDEWSFAMHDDLSSETNPSSDPGMEPSVNHSNEDLEISRNIQISNPFTLMKMATAKRSLPLSPNPNILNISQSKRPITKQHEGLGLEDTTVNARIKPSQPKLSTPLRRTEAPLRRVTEAKHSYKVSKPVKTVPTGSSNVSKPPLKQYTLPLIKPQPNVELANLPMKQYKQRTPNPAIITPIASNHTSRRLYSAINIRNIQCFSYRARINKKVMSSVRTVNEIYGYEVHYDTDNYDLDRDINTKIKEYYEILKGSPCELGISDSIKGLFCLR